MSEEKASTEVSNAGSIPSLKITTEEPQAKRSLDETKELYTAFRQKNAKDWLDALSSRSKKKPSEEQLAFLRAVISRCTDEKADETGPQKFYSEPARLILHGVPGASASLNLSLKDTQAYVLGKHQYTLLRNKLLKRFQKF